MGALLDDRQKHHQPTNDLLCTQLLSLNPHLSFRILFDRDRIVELLKLGVPARRIALKHLKYGTPSSLNYYIGTWELRDDLDSASS